MSIMKSKLLITFAIASIFSITANAITVESVLDSIESNNIHIKARIAEIKGKTSEIKSSNNLGDTEFGFEYQKGDNVEGNKYGFSVTQGFEWPGMYITRAKANKSKIKAAEYEFSSQKLDIMLNAKLVCLNIINANRKIKAQTDIYNNISQLYNEYEKGFKHGEISILDINKLKIELLNVKQALDKSITERNVLIEELTAINGDIAIAGVENIVDYPVQDLKAYDIYASEAISLDPVLNYSREVANSANKETTMAKMGWLPKFSVGYKFANELGSKFNGIAVGMSLPIFSNLNKVSMAKSEQISAEYGRQDTEIEMNSAIKNDYAQAVYLRSQIYSYNSVLTDSSNIEMLEKALSGGQISLLNYLLELRYFLEAQQTLLDLEFEYNSILAKLNKYSLL